MSNNMNEQLYTELEVLRKKLTLLEEENEKRISFEAICNAAMKKALEQNHPEDEINSFLASIGQSLQIDRVYIFEDDLEKDETSNTYEWCSDSIWPEISNLQNVPRSTITWWYDHFEKGLDIRIPDLEAIKETEPAAYSYLKPQGIHTLIARRLMRGDLIVGFFGVDNPDLELMPDISAFLDVMSNFLSLLIQDRNIYRRNEMRYVAALEAKNTALNEALDEARKANKAKSHFLSNMSHDIRTPMNAIIGMTAIAREHVNDPVRVMDSLQKITLSGQHLLGLINDILDMSKIESGKMTLRIEEASLQEIMDTVCEIIRTPSKGKDQTFEVSVENLLSNNVFCDSVRLNQILLNIMGNAVKYTPKGGSINVRMWQEESPKGADYVRTHFAIADDGIGMDPEFQKTIFEAFTRDDNNRVHKIQGTGLGMAITKRIVDAMNGTIVVESELNKGSIFYVTLDLHRAAKNESDTAAADMDRKNIDLSGVRILLAEDNEINAEIAIMILEESGMFVDHAEDGRIAVELFEKSEPGYYDAILMDLRMPNMDGLEATRTIRSLSHPGAKSIPIIAMTADAFSEDAQRCLNAGMNEHLAKPIDIDKLKQTLAKFING